MAFPWIPVILGNAYRKGRDVIVSQKRGGLCLYFVFSILGLEKHIGFQGLCCLLGKGKGRSLKLAARSGRSERARDWNEATLQEALIAPRSVDWPQLSSYPRLAPLCWASGSWSRVLLGGFQLSSNRGQYPIRCSSEDQLSGHDKMIKCQSLDQKPAHDVLDYWQIATAVFVLSPLVQWPRNIQVVVKGNEVL